MVQHHQLEKTNEERGAIALQKTELFSGPLPHPEVLAKYNAVVPGAAERIIAMAEHQASHRIALEKAVIESDIRNSRLGQLFGFIISIIGIIGSILLIIQGYTTGGTILGSGTIVSLVTIFVIGVTTRTKERTKKQQLIQEQSKP